MKTIIAVLGIALSLLSATTASATDIFTPGVGIGAASFVRCIVVNAGTTTAHNVRVAILNFAGVEQVTSGPLDVAPGATFSATDVTPASFVHCRVRGISSSKAKVSLCVHDAASTPVVCLTTP